MNKITEAKLKKYFDVAERALEKAEKSSNRLGLKNEREDCLDMIKRYYADADYFYKKGDFVNAFACLNYAHGWLDCGARIGLFGVKDSNLFTVDDV